MGYSYKCFMKFDDKPIFTGPCWARIEVESFNKMIAYAHSCPDAPGSGVKGEGWKMLKRVKKMGFDFEMRFATEEERKDCNKEVADEWKKHDLIALEFDAKKVTAIEIFVVCNFLRLLTENTNIFVTYLKLRRTKTTEWQRLMLSFFAHNNVGHGLAASYTKYLKHRTAKEVIAEIRAKVQPACEFNKYRMVADKSNAYMWFWECCSWQDKQASRNHPLTASSKDAYLKYIGEKK